MLTLCTTTGRSFSKTDFKVFLLKRFPVAELLRELASDMETDSINTETQINGDPKQDISHVAQSNSRIICDECRRKLRSLLPVNYKEEIIELLKLAGPVFTSQLMIFLISFISTVFCGHLGKTELAGVALAITGIIWPQIITGVAGNVLNALINYIFLYVLDLGVAGSAAANAISQYFLAVILFLFIRCMGLHKATWGGWSRDCLQEWGAFICLAFPSMIMLCAEWWTYEIGGFLAGLISEVELGAQSVVYELTSIMYMFPLGFAVAAGVRVGNALGAGNTEQAKLTAKLSLVCGLLVSCVIATIIGSTNNVIGYIFSTDEEIVLRVSEVMVMYGFVHLFDATSAITGGIVRGAGKQLLGALCNIVGYYFVGFPIGVSLMFALNMGIIGNKVDCYFRILKYWK
ncbi:hypothetical protein cypCar_00044818 [Cyprinus carpio]|nr:hypothetical protein cypCar_00044818 [Cyprinus carpio]